MMSVTELIDKIAAVEMPNVFNPWRHSDPMDYHNSIVSPRERCERLAAHFDCEPEFVLIGEAPGYQGCHFSGVPFTNERLLLDGRVPRVECPLRITTRERPWSEPSATIVWNQLHDMGIADRVVMWNAFAWHPHKPGEPMSNRAPTTKELVAGRAVLYAVLEHFKGVKIIAVGNVAAKALSQCSIGGWLHTVRHPSMGGANKFREQMNKIGGVNV